MSDICLELLPCLQGGVDDEATRGNRRRLNRMTTATTTNSNLESIRSNSRISAISEALFGGSGIGNTATATAAAAAACLPSSPFSSDSDDFYFKLSVEEQMKMAVCINPLSGDRQGAKWLDWFEATYPYVVRIDLTTTCEEDDPLSVSSTTAGCTSASAAASVTTTSTRSYYHSNNTNSNNNNSASGGGLGGGGGGGLGGGRAIDGKELNIAGAAGSSGSSGSSGSAALTQASTTTDPSPSRSGSNTRGSGVVVGIAAGTAAATAADTKRSTVARSHVTTGSAAAIGSSSSSTPTAATERKRGTNVLEKVELVLVAGGDGTVAWALDRLAKLFPPPRVEQDKGVGLGPQQQQTTPPPPPPPAIVLHPIGVGNELARCLGWSSGWRHAVPPVGTYRGKFARLLRRIHMRGRRVKHMDRWNVHFTPRCCGATTDIGRDDGHNHGNNCSSSGGCGGCSGCGGDCGGGGVDGLVVPSLESNTTGSMGDKVRDTAKGSDKIGVTTMAAAAAAAGDAWVSTKSSSGRHYGARPSSDTSATTAMSTTTNTTTMCCFFSVGFDADISHNFQEARKAYPSGLNNIAANKAAYALLGVQSLLAPPPAVSEDVALYVDNVQVPLPPGLGTIQVFNCHSSADGLDFFGIAQEPSAKDILRTHAVPDCGDGLLEVVGTTGVGHLIKVRNAVVCIFFCLFVFVCVFWFFFWRGGSCWGCNCLQFVISGL